MPRRPAHRLALKRVYLEPEPADGTRVLVERLWPRGLAKARGAVDLWLKEVAPSPELRRWFGHDPARWDEFCRRYRTEVKARPGPFHELQSLWRAGPVTLVYAARDEERNSARLLKELLEEAS